MFLPVCLENLATEKKRKRKLHSRFFFFVKSGIVIFRPRLLNKAFNFSWSISSILLIFTLKQYAEELVDDKTFAHLTNNNQRMYYISETFGEELEVDPSKIIDVVNMLKIKNQISQETIHDSMSEENK
ncbi:hypothetical protein ig2599ANME_0619 [groundwater metagenome]